MKTAEKGIQFTITHCDGYIANETISHISENGFVVCESCAVYTPEQIGMVLPKEMQPIWYEKRLLKIIGYFYDAHSHVFYGVDKNMYWVGEYPKVFMDSLNIPYLGINNLNT